MKINFFAVLGCLLRTKKILEFSQYQKHDKAPIIISADLEYLIEKIDGCKNNPENSSTTKVGEHIPSGLSMSSILSFKTIEYKHDVYRGEDCMKKFCEFLKIHKMEILILKRKKKEVINKRTSVPI